MYEIYTFDYIMSEMLSRISSKFDKREGSIIYDALAPAAVELAKFYVELEDLMSESFADTASHDFLVRRAAERGIFPKEATRSVLLGRFLPEGIDLAGKRFSGGNLNYVVSEKVADGWHLTCETAGEIGNSYIGKIIPIDYIYGLESGELVSVEIQAQDEEETESLRRRYFDSFDVKAYGGNIQDYLDKTNSLAGVGATKVTPVWNGGGTVKLTILNSTFGKASDTLVDFVQSQMDPYIDGTGSATAPIGHVVTVDTVREVPVSVKTRITFSGASSWETHGNAVEKAVADYLLELRRYWAEGNIVVRISQLETRILSLDGVLDIAGTSINSWQQNLELEEYEIPVLAEVGSPDE